MSTTITATYQHDDGTSTSRQLVVPFQLPATLGEQVGRGLLCRLDSAHAILVAMLIAERLGLTPPLMAAQVHIEPEGASTPADVSEVDG